MNLDEAIRSHVFWKVTLRWLVNGRKDLNIAAAGDDHACELGRWMFGDGAVYAELPGYARLVAEHRAFHRCAGEVARLAGAGQTEEPARMLADDGAFSLASVRTVDAIRALQHQAKALPPLTGGCPDVSR